MCRQEKSYDLQNSHQTAVNTIVTSQAQILTRRDYVTEKSTQNIHERITSVDNYDFIMQPYKTIPRLQLQEQRIGLEPFEDKAFKTKP